MKEKLLIQLHNNLDSMIGERVIFDGREYDIKGYSIFYDGVYSGLFLIENIESGDNFLVLPESLEQRENINLCYSELYEALFNAEVGLKNAK